MHIRIATSLDRDHIRSVYLSAFAEGEKEIVAKLAVNLLSEETTPQTISLVAETDGAVVGHLAFSPVTIGSDKNIQGYILAPLGVKPQFQNRGIGSKLVENGKQMLSGMDVDILFVYGDPKYYSRFGFRVEAAENFIPPYELVYPFGWQSIALSERSIKKSPVKLTCVASLNDPSLW